MYDNRLHKQKVTYKCSREVMLQNTRRNSKSYENAKGGN